MRTAVIADIHANLEALESVLERISELGTDEIVCLGDIVGYNANPNECVDIVRDRKIVSILGNHDICATGLDEPCSFNPTAERAVLWTRDVLTRENKSFIMSLPRELAIRDLYLFHGSIHDTNRYIMSKGDARENFRRLERLRGVRRIGFFGHTHVRMVLCNEQGSLSCSYPEEMLLPGVHQCLINPGSVGQPRDGDPRAAFLIYDSTERKITFHHVAYDIRKCRDKILQAGLPVYLADRLESGQ
jgi:diadenosine tetraphosphatase ApaH/serine/threonine PP2A family protein phosphatase